MVSLQSLIEDDEFTPDFDIYFDNAATSWPKPPQVLRVVERCHAMAGSAGRTAGDTGGDLIEECREIVANFLGVLNCSRLAFSSGCTEALNQGVRGLSYPGRHRIISSGLPHHALSRSIDAMCGLPYFLRQARSPWTPEMSFDLDWLEEELKKNDVGLVACTLVSNVTGEILPCAEIGELTKRYEVPFLIDGSQGVGHLASVDVEQLKADIFCCPGHKGMLGIKGAGALWVREGIEMKPFLVGGTGKDSGKAEMSAKFPSSFEVGSHNLAAIAAMATGVKVLEEIGREQIEEHERELTRQMLAGLSEIPGVTIFGPNSPERRTGVISFRMEGFKPEEIACYLLKEKRVATRAKFHCASRAHQTLGTCSMELGGTLRMSFGCQNTAAEVETVLGLLSAIQEDSRQTYQI